MPDKIHILRTRNEQSPRCSGYPVSKSGNVESMSKKSNRKSTNEMAAVNSKVHRPINMIVSIRKTRLMLFDLVVLTVSSVLTFWLYPTVLGILTAAEIAVQLIAAAICIMGMRCAGKIYLQVWRYSRINSYLRLMCTDVAGGILYLLLGSLLYGTNPPLLSHDNLSCCKFDGQLGNSVPVYVAV